MADASKRTRNLIIGAVAVVLVVGVAAAAAVVATKDDSNGTGWRRRCPWTATSRRSRSARRCPPTPSARRACTARRGSPAPRTPTANNTKPKQPVELADDPAYNDEFQAKYKPRVTGNFTGTTDEIIQWGACKWGLSDNIVRAQAVDESHWRQNTESDPEPRSSGNCPPGTTDDPVPHVVRHPADQVVLPPDQERDREAATR